MALTIYGTPRSRTMRVLWTCRPSSTFKLRASFPSPSTIPGSSLPRSWRSTRLGPSPRSSTTASRSPSRWRSTSPSPGATRRACSIRTAWRARLTPGAGVSGRKASSSPGSCRTPGLADNLRTAADAMEPRGRARPSVARRDAGRPGLPARRPPLRSPPPERGEVCSRRRASTTLDLEPHASVSRLARALPYGRPAASVAPRRRYA